MDEERFRTFLGRMAQEAAPRPGVPPRMVRRARWRRARTAVAGVVALGLIGSGAFTGLRALTGVRHQLPVAVPCDWTQTATPNPGNVSNSLVGVGAAAADDVWAVGSYAFKPGGYSPPPPGTIGGPNSFGESHALALHWDGRQWSRVAMPDPPDGEQGTRLTGIVAIARDDVWATGTTALGGRSYIEHWDGAKWRVVPTPASAAGLFGPHGLAASGPSDIWLVGGIDEGVHGVGTLTMHWDGTTWQVIPTPHLGSRGVELTAVVALAPKDAWVVGFAVHTPIAMHWDGSSWSLVSLPGQGLAGGPKFYQLHDIAARGDGGLVALATSYKKDDGMPQTLGLILSWDGTHWRIAERHPGTELRDVVMDRPGDAWITGSTGWDSNSYVTPIVLHWDGARTIPESTPVLPPEATISASALLSGGELWVVGSDQRSVPPRILALHRPCSPSRTSSSASTTPAPSSTANESSPPN